MWAKKIETKKKQNSIVVNMTQPPNHSNFH